MYEKIFKEIKTLITVIHRIYNKNLSSPLLTKLLSLIAELISQLP